MPIRETLSRLLRSMGPGRDPGEDDKAASQTPTIPGSNIDKVNEYTEPADPDDGEPAKF